MRTCLVADDSSVVRKVARHIFESHGFSVVEASDGRQALDLVLREMPAAILLDWSMPTMDGFDVLKALRAMPGGDQPKVMFCAVENDLATLARARHGGADETILKPFDHQVLTAKMHAVGLI
ncbi:response regulator [Bosea sp. 117]|uniref:response regulator n=1 Tax=Bosea sp. 117 TaxID=1125973 RepID=UPI0004948DBA|nr:response regulator [Bosea sp. 117]